MTMKSHYLILSFVLIGLISPALYAQQKEITNSIGMEFVLIPAGSFEMGTAQPKCPEDDPFTSKNEQEECLSKVQKNETPRHKVTITSPFYLGKYEVTQEQWVAVMGSNPSKFKSRSNPVEQVSWNDIQQFIEKLNKKEGKNEYRLPTEAEWEYAARAGTSTQYSFGDSESALGQYAWYYGNSGDTTHPVGQLKPNAWGLYDIHGNVREWVQDWYGKNYYSQSPSTDPTGPSTGSGRVLRGGSWNFPAWYCRSAFRHFDSPFNRYDYDGFRLALSPGR
ncbi:MAG: formylglycine-generating enzyme family protein [SAR324 cluster bacterium]|nr:formylglycine-generating enzyme family protein [SAR324 cluster bacterium]